MSGVTPPADEQLEFLKLVVQRLESAGIQYMLTGSTGSRTGTGMSDTPVEVEELQRRLLMERSPAERLRMATGMFRLAVALATAGVQAQLGPVSAANLRRELLWRFYKIDPTPPDGHDSEPLRKATKP